jgi:thiosulfate/3-mercaptopyruvate sulfurtransferase
MLISTEELTSSLERPDWIVFDCRHDLVETTRGRELYAAGHIAGAFFAHVDEDLSGVKTGRNGRHPLPDPEAFASFLASAGVTASSRLIAYDDVGGQYAARFWWLCRWIGHGGAAVLDGGWDKWESEGRPTSTESPAPVSGRVEVQLHPELLVTLPEVEGVVAGAPGLVVDARAPARYRGETEPLDPVAGHIPGARNVFFQTNLREDLTFKSPRELRSQWEAALADTAASSVVHQCGSGITACANLLAMEQAGMQGSRLYAGSWSEWCADAARPVATGED